MGAEPFRVFYVNPGTPDRFLKKAHHIQMPDIFHRSIFGKFNSYLHA
jgi:hypothetical protein